VASWHFAGNIFIARIRRGASVESDRARRSDDILDDIVQRRGSESGGKTSRMTAPTASAVWVYFCHLEDAVARALLDFEGVLAAGGHPGQARAAQVVEA
jgi:hypothetical protein